MPCVCVCGCRYPITVIKCRESRDTRCRAMIPIKHSNTGGQTLQRHHLALSCLVLSCLVWSCFVVRSGSPAGALLYARVQYSGVHYSIAGYITVHHDVSQYMTVCHGTWQYTTVHHSISQYIIVHCSMQRYTTAQHSTLQYTAVYYSTTTVHPIRLR